MAYFFSGSGQYLTGSTAPVARPPLTIAAWSRPTSMTGSRTVIYVGQTSGAAPHRYQLVMSATGIVRFTVRAGTGVNIATETVATASINQWCHVAGVVNSTTSRTVYLNGGNSVTTTTDSGGYENATAIAIGAQWGGNGWENPWIGDLAEVGVWNVALDAAEIASLAKGIACRLIRPQNLVFYAPLIRDLADVRGGLTITNNNTATVANHPRIYA